MILTTVEYLDPYLQPGSTNTDTHILRVQRGTLREKCNPCILQIYQLDIVLVNTFEFYAKISRVGVSHGFRTNVVRNLS